MIHTMHVPEAEPRLSLSLSSWRPCVETMILESRESIRECVLSVRGIAAEGEGAPLRRGRLAKQWDELARKDCTLPDVGTVDLIGGESMKAVCAQAAHPLCNWQGPVVVVCCGIEGRHDLSLRSPLG